MFKVSSRTSGKLLPLAVALLLFPLLVGCKKRAGPSTVDQVPVTVSDPAPEKVPPAPEPAIPVEPEPAAEPEPDPIDPIVPAWEAGDLLFSRLDFEDACQVYSESDPALPEEVRARAILACATGSAEQRELSRQWLAQQLKTETSDPAAARWRAFEQVLAQMEGESEKVAQLRREMAKLAEELEKLKKIDAQRRRP